MNTIIISITIICAGVIGSVINIHNFDIIRGIKINNIINTISCLLPMTYLFVRLLPIAQTQHL